MLADIVDASGMTLEEQLATGKSYPARRANNAHVSISHVM